MDISLLKQLGFTNNDLAVYSVAVELGVAKSGAIVSRSGVVSSRVYASLAKLQRHGLVSSFVRNNVRYYKSEPPQQLVTELKEQIVGLEELGERIKHVAAQAAAPARVAVYEGSRGYRQAFTQHIENLSTNTELQIIGYGSVYRTEAEVRNFFKRIDEQMVLKKVKAKMVIDGSLQGIMKTDRRHRSAYELKVLPSGYFSSMAVNIAPHEVLLSIIGQHPIAICLRDEQAIQGYQKHFKLLWSIGKPV
jgi:sugar-specific transcriptional regulator TrmB